MLPPNFPRADCHCHTFYSDGSLSPIELLSLAQQRSLTGLSITDHDTLAAYETAVPYAQQLGIELVSGIEISTEHQNTSVHVLGYAFHRQHPALLALCDAVQQARIERNHAILHQLAKCNMPLTWDEVSALFPHQGTLGRPHIAAAMVKKGYVSTAQHAFQRYLGNDRRCYVKGTLISVEHAIEILHQAGGYAVLAHPHYINSKKLLRALSELPFDGIEAFYGRLPPTKEKPWVMLAQTKNWFVTGGSDFHGDTKPHALLGSSWTPAEVFEEFKKRNALHEAAS